MRAFTTRYQCFCAGFGFTAVYGFIAVTCNLVVTFGDTHWAELVWPQRWAGVREPAHPKGKARQGKVGTTNVVRPEATYPFTPLPLDRPGTRCGNYNR